MKNYFVYIIFISVLTLWGCDRHKQKSVTSNNSQIMTKPFPDYRLSFFVLSEDKLNKVTHLSNLSVQQLAAINRTISDALIDYHNSSVGAYANFYNRYEQALPFKALADMKYMEAKHLTTEVQKQLDANKLPADRLTSLEALYVRFLCEGVFKDDWVMEPEMYFSDNFYKNIIPDGTKILFSQESYQEGRAALPFKISNNDLEDEHDVQPVMYSIDKRIAKELLNQIKPTKDEFLQIESQLFRQLLTGVMEGRFRVIVSIYNDQRI